MVVGGEPAGLTAVPYTTREGIDSQVVERAALGGPLSGRDTASTGRNPNPPPREPSLCGHGQQQQVQRPGAAVGSRQPLSAAEGLRQEQLHRSRHSLLRHLRWPFLQGEAYDHSGRQQRRRREPVIGQVRGGVALLVWGGNLKGSRVIQKTVLNTTRLTCASRGFDLMVILTLAHPWEPPLTPSALARRENRARASTHHSDAPASCPF